MDEFLNNAGWIIALAIVAWVAYRAKKLGYFDNAADKPSAPVALSPYPCIIEGTIKMPPLEIVRKARDIALADGGIAVPAGASEVEKDTLCSVTFGGGDYGGMYLVGSFHFEIDAQGQRIDEKSWLALFNDKRFSVSGGIAGDGSIGMASMSIGGTPISGRIVDGKLVDGRVTHGDGKVHIYGVMDGTWRAA